MNTTNGPWDYHCSTDENGRNNGSVIADFKSGRAVCVAKAPQYASKEQWEADAKLISAAPDLLNCLIRIRGCITETSGPDADIAVFFADELIKKLS